MEPHTDPAENEWTAMRRDLIDQGRVISLELSKLELEAKALEKRMRSKTDQLNAIMEIVRSERLEPN